MAALKHTVQLILRSEWGGRPPLRVTIGELWPRGCGFDSRMLGEAVFGLVGLSSAEPLNNVMRLLVSPGLQQAPPQHGAHPVRPRPTILHTGHPTPAKTARWA